ncbi:MAG: protein BatD [Nitrospinae bacterium]|nr:protein BatD [Nitrospinota bacterium]
MKALKIFILFHIFFFASLEFSFATNLELSANPETAGIYERVLLTVKVTDGDLKTSPGIKGTDAINIENSGKSSSFSMINGKSESSVTYSFVVTSTKKGSYSIYAEGEDDNGKIQSNKITLNITDVQQNQKKSGLDNDKLFIKTELSAAKGFLQQQINYKLKFYTAYDIQETKLTLPSFEGFWVENVGKEKQYTEMINGHRFIVFEINKALFPQKEGHFELEPARIYCKIIQRKQQRDPFGQFFNDPFFMNPFSQGNLISQTVVSKTNIIDVVRLPENPKGTSSELVGNYFLSESLSSKDLKVGDSTTLTIQISGDGNLNLFELPEINIESLKSYKDKPVVTQSIQGDKVVYSKEFKVALIPEKEGVITIPKIEIPYYNTFENKWAVLSGKEFILTVTKGTKSIAPSKEEIVAEKKVIPTKKATVLGKDILPIFSGDALYTDVGVNDNLNTFLYVFVGIFFLFGCSLLYYYSSYRPSFDTDHMRRTKAASNASRKLKTTNDIHETSLILKEFIGDKTNRQGVSLTSEEIKALFDSREINPSVTETVLKLLEEIEASLYGGVNDINLKEIKSKVQEIIREIDLLL